MISRTISSLVLVLASLLVSGIHGQANDSEKPVEKTEKEKPSARITRGTRLFDAQQVNELFEKTRRENAERAKNAPVHLNPEELELYNLSPFRVKADEADEVTRRIKERLDPDYREKRLEAIKRLDPQAYYNMKLSQRNEEVFFRGERDLARPEGAPIVETFTDKQMLEALENTTKFLKKVFGGRTRDDER